jgi:hypothetical protein
VTSVRDFPADGSTFLDGDYLIEGVAGRILWSLLCQFDAEGRVDFPNPRSGWTRRWTCPSTGTTWRAA